MTSVLPVPGPASINAGPLNVQRQTFVSAFNSDGFLPVMNSAFDDLASEDSLSSPRAFRLRYSAMSKLLADEDYLRLNICFQILRTEIRGEYTSGFAFLEEFNYTKFPVESFFIYTSRLRRRLIASHNNSPPILLICSSSKFNRILNSEPPYAPVAYKVSTLN
jgi:hypothetical protein